MGHAQGTLEARHLERGQAVELGAQIDVARALVSLVRHHPADHPLRVDPFDGAKVTGPFLQRGCIGLPFGARHATAKLPAALHLAQRRDARFDRRRHAQHQLDHLVPPGALQLGAFRVEQAEPHTKRHRAHQAANHHGQPDPAQRRVCLPTAGAVQQQGASQRHKRQRGGQSHPRKAKPAVSHRDVHRVAGNREQRHPNAQQAGQPGDGRCHNIARGQADQRQSGRDQADGGVGRHASRRGGMRREIGLEKKRVDAQRYAKGVLRQRQHA